MSSWYVNVVSGVPLIRLEGWPLFIGFECENIQQNNSTLWKMLSF